MDHFTSLKQACADLHLNHCLLPLLRGGIRSVTALRATSVHDLSAIVQDRQSARALLSWPEVAPPQPTAELRPPAEATARRADFPAIQTSRGRGSMKRVHEALATDLGRSSALAAFDADEFANSTKAPRQAKWNTWVRLVSAWGLEPLPLTPAVVRAAGASMKLGHYRNPEQYFSRAKQEHVAQFDASPSAATLQAIKRAIASVTRGVGPPSRKDGFCLELLEPHTPRGPLSTLHQLTSWSQLPADAALDPIRMSVLGGWFLTRGIELAAAEAHHLALDMNRNTVTFFLPVSKTDTAGVGAHRAHGCCCSRTPRLPGAPGRHGLCPFHTALDYMTDLKSFFGTAWLDSKARRPLFPDRLGRFLSKAAVVAAVRQAAHLAGEVLVAHGPDGSERQRFSEHALRVAGAQMLARHHVELYIIQLIGRWGSQAILRYVQEAPLLHSSSIAIRVFPADGPEQRPSAPLATSREQTSATSATADAISRLEAQVAQLQSHSTAPSTAHSVIRLVNRQIRHIVKSNEAQLHSSRWQTFCGLRYGMCDFERCGPDSSQADCIRCAMHVKSHLNSSSSAPGPSDIVSSPEVSESEAEA